MAPLQAALAGSTLLEVVQKRRVILLEHNMTIGDALKVRWVGNRRTILISLTFARSFISGSCTQ